MRQPFFIRSVATNTWVNSKVVNPRTGKLTKYYIAMITVNPDPKKNSYQDMSETQQEEYIKSALTKALTKVKLIKIMDGVFEYTRNHQRHWHGTIACFTTESNMYGLILKFGKAVAKLVGRGRGVPWYVSCYIDGNDDVNKWRRYIKKTSISYWPHVPIILSSNTSKTQTKDFDDGDSS